MSDRPPLPRPRHRRAAAVTAGALALLSTACSGSAADGPSGTTPARTTTAAPTTSPASTTATPDTTATTGSGTITLAFGGDVHFADHVADLLDDPENGGLADLAPLLGRADVAMVNLETAITERGTEQPKKFHFRTDARALTALASTGVDVVTMANNHTVDYGPDGLADTLKARASSRIPVVGIGKDADDAYTAAVLPVRGVRVAVLGATQVPDWTLATWPASSRRPGVASSSGRGLTRLTEAVRSARRKADVVVVYLHWGTDYTICPDAAQKRTARALADAGADVIVGGHAHRVQGSGWAFGSYVGYGLGNFVWWRWRDPADTTTGVLELTLRTGGRADAQGRTATVTADRWTPLRVREDGVPREGRTASERAAMLDRREQAQRCSGLSEHPPTS